VITVEYKIISKVYNLGDGILLGVDQSNSSEDKTCLCIGEVKDGIMNIKEIKCIEKQDDMDKYVNRNLAKIYEVFGVSNLD